MTKFKVQGWARSEISEHWVWEVEADTQEEADHKIIDLFGEDTLPYRKDDKANNDEIRCVKESQDVIDTMNFDIEYFEEEVEN